MSRGEVIEKVDGEVIRLIDLLEESTAAIVARYPGVLEDLSMLKAMLSDFSDSMEIAEHAHRMTVDPVHPYGVIADHHGMSGYAC